MSENKFIEKLKDHDERFDKIDRRFDRIEEKLKDHDAKFDRVFNKLLDHDTKFEQLEFRLNTKMDEVQGRILSAIDGVVMKNSDIDLEQLSTRVALDRHQDEINANKKDILKIKKVVKIA